MGLANFVDAPLRMLFGASHFQNTDFEYIEYERLLEIARNPYDLSLYEPKQAKERCPFFLPSDALTKSKADVLERNSFNALVADIDGDDRALDQIVSQVLALGLKDFLVYGTLSHRYQDPEKGDMGNRFRIVIPLSKSIEFSVWENMQGYLIQELHADPCTSRAQQISYLPATCCTQTYEFHIERGGRLDPANSVASFVRSVKQFERFQSDSIQKLQSEKPSPKPVTYLAPEGHKNPVTAFNESNTIEDLLERYQFKKVGRKYIHPSSVSGKPGVVVLDGRYFSHHTSDPMADGHTHDAFDLYVEFECGGNFKDAIEKAKGKYCEESNAVSREPEVDLSLEAFGINSQLEVMKKQMLEDTYVLKHLALSGQITVIYAKPNAGKTLLAIWLLIRSIDGGEVDGRNIFYINADDTYKGSIEKAEYLDPYQVTVIIPGYKNFDTNQLCRMLLMLCKQNKAEGKVIILDTLKKFTDLMDKPSSSRFMNVLREFVANKGSVVLLAHANKNLSDKGKIVPGGTSDIVDDADCVYTLNVIEKDVVKTVVEFENIKQRGNVTSKLSCRYRSESDNYKQLIDSVEIIDEDTSIRIREIKRMRELESKSKDIVDEIKRLLSHGPLLKTILVKQVCDLTSATRRTVSSVLARHAGADSELCQYWQFNKGEKNAQIYTLNSSSIGD